MPIPFLLVGAGVAAGALGIGGHLSAKEKNERAESVSRDAQNIYNSAKSSLEIAQGRSERALLQLGYLKKNILDSTMRQFVNAYDKVQHVSFTQTSGLNELSNFSIDQQGVLQMQEMANIYSGSLASGATGAAAGAVIALAASGELVIVTDVLGIAGSALAAGEIGAAAGLAGSALSFGAAMTPLGAIAAPVLLFTGISASMKADENLEKANTMHAQAEAAVEKMKISETLCGAISDRSDMFNGVLSSLNGMFTECVDNLEQLILRKEKRLTKNGLTSNDFSENDLRLLAVTGALAGAIKSVIDTPILAKDGTITGKSKETYDKVKLELPKLNEEIEVIKTLEYDMVPGVENQTPYRFREPGAYRNDNSVLYYARWIGAGFFFLVGIFTLFSGLFPITLISLVVGLNICPKTSKIALKYDRWFVAAIFWVLGISTLFTGLIPLAIILVIVGLNICPATSLKTREIEKRVVSKIKGFIGKK